jgi:hypothetical protein
VNSILDVRPGTLAFADSVWTGSHPFHLVVKELAGGRCVLTVSYSDKCPLCRDVMARRQLLRITPGDAPDGPRPAA